MFYPFYRLLYNRSMHGPPIFIAFLLFFTLFLCGEIFTIRHILDTIQSIIIIDGLYLFYTSITTQLSLLFLSKLFIASAIQIPPVAKQMRNNPCASFKLIDICRTLLLNNCYHLFLYIKYISNVSDRIANSSWRCSNSLKLIFICIIVTISRIINTN